MASNLYNELTSNEYQPEEPLCSRSNLSVKENGMKYSLQISDYKNRKSTVFQVDGYLIKEGCKCDKLVLIDQADNNWAEIFVELKGKNVKHGLEQLEATLNNKLLKHPRNIIIRARIVAASFPSNKSDKLMAQKKIDFMKNFHCELRPMKNGQTDKI